MSIIKSPALDKPAAVNSPKHSAFCSGSPCKQVRSTSSLSHPNSGCRYLRPHLAPGNHHLHRKHQCTGQCASPARARLQDLPRGWEWAGTCQHSHPLLKAFLQLSFPTVNSWCRETIKKRNPVIYPPGWRERRKLPQQRLFWMLSRYTGTRGMML